MSPSLSGLSLSSATDTATPTPNPYVAQFQGYILRAVEQALHEVEATPDLLTDGTRKQALHLLDMTLERPDFWPLLRQLLLLMAPKMEQAGYRGEWIAFLERAIAQAQIHTDGESQIEFALFVGRLYEFTGDLVAATAHFEQGLALAEQMGDRRNQGRCLGRLAYIARLRHELETATELVNRALDLIGVEDPERARIHAVLGTIAYAQEAWEQAAESYLHALAIWKAVDNRRMIAWSLRDLGTVYRRQADLEQSIACYECALHHFAAIDDPVHQASTQMNLGNVYLDLNRPHEALTLYEVALSAFRDVYDLRRLAMGYKNLGIAYRQLQYCEKAVSAFQQSIQIRQQLDSSYLLADAMVELGITYLEFQLNQQAIVVFMQAKEHLSQISHSRATLNDIIDQYIEQLGIYKI